MLSFSSKKLDVVLTPLECLFEGFVKMLFIEIPFTIFHWKADDIERNIFTKVLQSQLYYHNLSQFSAQTVQVCLHFIVSVEVYLQWSISIYN